MLQKFYNQEKIDTINKYILYILLGMMVVVPIVTYKYISISYSPKFMNNFYGTGEKTDVFNFFKTILLYLGTAGILGMFMYKVVVLNEDIKESKLNIFLFIFLVGIVLSALMSNYKDIALFGNFDRHEGSLAWFCYITIFFVLYNIEIEDKYYKLFYFMLMPFLVINTTLGILNLYNINILESKIIQFIIGGHGTIGGKLWTTLYNPNFSGGIAGVIFAISFIYLLLEENKTKKQVIFLGAIFSFIIVLTSKSISGFSTVILTTPLALIIGWKFSDKKRFIIWSLILMLVSIFVLILMSKYDSKIYKETFGVFETINGINKFILPSILILFILALLILKFINKKRFFDIATILTLIIILTSCSIYIVRTKSDNIKIESTVKENVVRIQDTAIFKKLDTISNHRISIWNETGKLLIESPIIGYGFDTLPYELDHTKQEGVYETVTIDKPHNTLLLILYGSGFIGLISFLLIMWYLIRESFFKYVDNINDKYVYVSIVGVIAYLIQGMINDTFVGTSIIFWIFAGICANRLVSENNEKVVYVD